MAHIEKTTLIHAPIEKVYAFARDPNHWSDWWVGLSEAENITGTGEAGTVVRHHYKLAGISFPVTSRVLEDRPGPKEAYWKGTFAGLLSGQHEWTSKAMGEATEVTVKIDYTVPGKALGRFADRLLIERLQEKAMEHTLENMKVMCESEVRAEAAVPR